MADKKAKFPYKDAVIPKSMGRLVCDSELCAGCMNCMLACTINKDGAASPELARIQMNVHTQAEFDICAQPCLQCEDPKCMRACPVGAIVADETTGARVIVPELCIRYRHSRQHHTAGREAGEAVPATQRSHSVPSIRLQKETKERIIPLPQ